MILYIKMPSEDETVKTPMSGGKRGKRKGSRRRMRRSRRYQNQNEQENQQQGGNSASEVVAKTAGLPGQQVGTNGNSGALVLAKPTMGGSSLMPSTLAPATLTMGGNVVSGAAKYGGGEDLEKMGGKKGKKGGNLLGQIAVPAVLLYANQMVGRRRTKNRRSGRRSSRGRRSRRFRR
jgi:hypothetical protein